MTSLPLLSLVTPLAMAVVMWLVTSSPAMMLMAALGPVAMVASFGDAWRVRRVQARDQERARVRDVAEQDSQAIVRAAREAEQARRDYPSVADLLSTGDELVLPAARHAGHIRIGLDEARRPVLVPASVSLCVVGSPLHAQRLIRCLRLTFAWHGFADAESRVTQVSQMSRVPDSADIILSTDGHHASPGWAYLIDRGRTIERVGVLMDDLSHPQEVQIHRALGRRQQRVNHTPAFVDVLARTPETRLSTDVRGVAGCALTGDEPAPLGISLIEDGPHFLLSGATGSGKTETLVALVASMAASSTPREFTFAIIDFKGGGGFTRLEGLPHCRGVSTDLDLDDVARAFVGITVEMRHRENLLRHCAQTDVSAVSADSRVARLLIIIDEYRALCEQIPEARGIVADIAARGRALGVHLMVASQRASGAFGDDLVVNAQTRMCLAPVSDDDAHYLLGERVLAAGPDRQIHLRRRSGIIELATPLMVDDETLERAALNESETRGPSSEATEPLWFPALPARLSVADIAAARKRHSVVNGAILLGLRQDARTTAWLPAVYDPAEHGSLWVFGGPQSGKTSLLMQIIRDSPRACHLVSTEPALAWDEVVSRAATVRQRSGDPELLVVDGVDALLSGLPDDYRDDMCDALEVIARDGAGRGLTLVISSSIRDATLVRVCRHGGETIQLTRFPGQADTVHFVSTRSPEPRTQVPGRGFWGDDEVQFRHPGDEVTPSTAEHRQLLCITDMVALESVVVLAGDVSLWRNLADSQVFTPETALADYERFALLVRTQPLIWDGLGRRHARLLGIPVERIHPPTPDTVVIIDINGKTLRARRCPEQSAPSTVRQSGRSDLNDSVNAGEG
ncbi:MAG: hypothetical protein F2808_00750 [Actinobacteria bacterium]|uniref:Unannotated protein n=1 Tax=freshwater metagenome TaxID=449393 RepID=A0A6J7EZ62_9ZZZZ|nr:hypothetical protein [Actinomycetota bacterium]